MTRKPAAQPRILLDRWITLTQLAGRNDNSTSLNIYNKVNKGEKITTFYYSIKLTRRRLQAFKEQ
jgi:hypothetical protein